MIKIEKLLNAVVMIALTIGMVACAKDGQMGPPGKDGRDGRDGIAGVDGKDGEDGKDGTNDVKAYVFVVDNTDWERGSTSTFEYSLSAINADVVDNGVVIGYVRSVDYYNEDSFVNETWTALPYSKVGFIAVNNQAATITIGYGYDSGEINLSLFANANIPLPETIPSSSGGQVKIPGDLEFKFVVIPPVALIDGVSKDATYEEIMQVYNFETIELY